jgi:hypothetical protein
MNSVNFDKVKRGDQQEIAKILAIILINCHLKNNQPICEAAKRLTPSQTLVLKQIIGKAQSNPDMLKRTHFYEDMLMEKTSQSNFITQV